MAIVKIAVVGGSGHTGRLVVEQALARGWEVNALMRHPDALELQDEALTVCAVDVLDQVRLQAALVGCDAVVSALGIGSSRAETQVYSVGIHNVLQAMQAQAVRRITVISATPAGPRQAQAFFERRIMMPILDRVFGATYRDMRRMEAILLASNADWVVLRPPRLTAKSATGSYRLQTAGRLPNARSLTYGDLATALLDCLENPDVFGRALDIAN